MLEQLRALLAHFGEIADPRASQFAHVPAELWDDLKAKVADPAYGVVHTAVTDAEQSVRAGGTVAVQLQAGHLALLHEVLAANTFDTPPPEATPDPTEGEAPTVNPSEGDPPPPPSPPQQAVEGEAPTENPSEGDPPPSPLV